MKSVQAVGRPGMSHAEIRERAFAPTQNPEPAHVQSRKDVLALLIEVDRYREAMLQAIADAQQMVGMDDPFGSQGPPILVGANAWFGLQEALGNPE